MGTNAENHQIGRDFCRGVVAVRISISLGRPAMHLPSPPMGRRSLWRLWLWSREPRKGALPKVLTEAWWWALTEGQQAGVRAVVQSVSALEWVSWWWDAPAEDPPEQVGAVVGVEVGERVGV